jgi:hypothetical protein
LSPKCFISGIIKSPMAAGDMTSGLLSEGPYREGQRQCRDVFFQVRARACEKHRYSPAMEP